MDKGFSSSFGLSSSVLKKILNAAFGAGWTDAKFAVWECFNLNLVTRFDAQVLHERLSEGDLSLGCNRQ